MDIKKIAVVTAIYKRYELTDFVLNYYHKLKQELNSIVNIELFIAGSEKNKSKKLVEKYNFKYIETPNSPLSSKFNKTLIIAKKWSPDAVVIIGSDDLLSKQVFITYNELITKKIDTFGFIDIYFLANEKLTYWKGYTNHRNGETIGAGRFISKKVLNELNWKLWKGEKRNNGLDALLTKNLADIGIVVKGRKLKKDEYIVDVKTDFNICKIQNYVVEHKSIKKLHNFLSKLEVVRVLNLTQKKEKTETTKIEIKKSTKKVIYTALFGDYDNFVEPDFIDKDFDYVIFTNQNIKSKLHKVVKINNNPLITSNVKMARFVKILPHIYLPQYDLTVWHDANIIQQKSVLNVIDSMKTNFLTMKHNARNCIYKEAELCKERNKDRHDIINKQIEFYRKNNYPINNGLIASGIIIRKQTDEIANLCNTWQELVKTFSHRDQLSFNYALHLHQINIDLVDYYKILTTEFKLNQHKNS